MKGRAKLTVTFPAEQASPLGTIHLLLELWDARSTGCCGLPGFGSREQAWVSPTRQIPSQLWAEQSSEFCWLLVTLHGAEA